MAGDTIIIGNWNDTTPAAPAGADNVKFQKDASSPPNISAHVARADTAGTKYGTIIYDGSGNANRYLGADGNWHDMPAGSLPTGGTTGQVLTVLSESPYSAGWEDPPSANGNGVIAYTPPVLTDFAWINQQSAVAVQNGSTVFLTNAVDTGNNYNILKKSLGALTQIEAWIAPYLMHVNYNDCGITLRESSSGKLIIFSFEHNVGLKNTAMGVFRLTNPTTYTSTNASMVSTFSQIGLRFRIVAGTPNVINFEYSRDGLNWITLTTENYGSFFTPDEVGFHINRYHNSGRVGMSLISWKEY